MGTLPQQQQQTLPQQQQQTLPQQQQTLPQLFHRPEKKLPQQHQQLPQQHQQLPQQQQEKLPQQLGKELPLSATAMHSIATETMELALPQCLFLPFSCLRSSPVFCSM